jgi:Protein of unknown function (DUF1501)
MYDLKPNAPDGVRSLFQPIRTNVPGIHVCEHLPLTAKWMDRTALIRSVNHKAGCHNCLPSYCGFEQPMPDQHPRDTDHPSMGSVCELLNKKRGPENLPAYVYMPNWLGWGQAFRRAGPYSGFLGKRYDPFTTECQPHHDPGTAANSRLAKVRGVPLLPNTDFPAGLTIDRFNRRKDLLHQIDDERRRVDADPALQKYTDVHQRALGLLTGSDTRSAFDLDQEPVAIRESYGNTLFGNSALIARRLVERGVRFVNVTFDLYEKFDIVCWDTHGNNFGVLKANKLPVFDQVYTALLDDLQSRGLLEETLVLVTSEMGRTPRINAGAGRDHWAYCYGSMLAGAGIKGGTVVGASDASAAYVKDRPVSTTEICATVYHLLGINPDMPVHDRSGRPVPVALGAQFP